MATIGYVGAAASYGQTVDVAPGSTDGGNDTEMIPTEHIAQAIQAIRGQKVLLDADLAALYGVETKVLLQAVRRNRERFPEDFMFQLTDEEFDGLRSQSVTSSWGVKNRARSMLQDIAS